MEQRIKEFDKKSLQNIILRMTEFLSEEQYEKLETIIGEYITDNEDADQQVQEPDI